jgi:hypothetical protein|tara:strand:- start:146 stop:301 length:156 start_codon:yes stop_codon:yes gene_type:complete
MDNKLKQINNNVIKLTKNGESKTYFKVIPGVDEYTVKDLTSFIKYKGEYYA